MASVTGHEADGPRTLVEASGCYVYLPRVAAPATIEAAVADRKSLLSDEETFSLADGFDQEANHYVGLRVGRLVAETAISRSTLLVKPAVARAQVEREQGAAVRDGSDAGVKRSTDRSTSTEPDARGRDGSESKLAAQSTVYVGSKRLDPARVGSAAGQIAEEVLQHLSPLPGAEVEVRIEIQVHVAKGIPEHAKRVVGENARALKFDTSGFSD